jgi:hypothetical protein
MLTLRLPLEPLHAAAFLLAAAGLLLGLDAHAAVTFPADFPAHAASLDVLCP